MPVMSNPFWLVDRNVVGERGQQCEMQNKYPAGKRAWRVPVVDHPHELKEHIDRQSPLEQRPDQQGHHLHELEQTSHHAPLFWLQRGRFHRFPDRCLGKLDDVGHALTLR